MCEILFDQCPICDAEEQYIKDNPRDKTLIKSEQFAKLWLQLKSYEDQCYQLKKKLIMHAATNSM